jgi:hypothetical protein
MKCRPGRRKDEAELGRKPQPETEGMLMMPAVVRRPYRLLMGDIIGGTLSGAAFLRRCLGTGSDASACSQTLNVYKRIEKSTQFGVNLMRSRVSYWAAQDSTSTASFLEAWSVRLPSILLLNTFMAAPRRTGSDTKACKQVSNVHKPPAARH